MSAPHVPDDRSGEDYPYPWDDHMKTVKALNHLDRLDLKVNRNRVDKDVLQSLILKGPYGSNPVVEEIGAVDAGVLAAYGMQRHRSLSGLIYRQIKLTQTRADFIARTAESLASLFPEQKFRPELALMVDSAEMQIADLRERNKVLHGVISNATPAGPDEKMREHQRVVCALRTLFNDTAEYDDPAPVADRLPVLKEACQRLSVLSLEQAGVQQEIAGECLSVVATGIFLHRIFREKSLAGVAPLKDLVASSLLAAMVDLEYAAELRTGIYMMEQTSRPSFPTGLFLV